jgi:NADH-quinone oxidoreductase subunit J
MVFQALLAQFGRIELLYERFQMVMAHPLAGLIVRCVILLGCAGGGIYLMLPRGQRAGRRLERYAGGLLATFSLIMLVTVPLSAGLTPAGLDAQPGVTDSQFTLLWSLDDQPKVTCYTFHALAFLSLGSAVMMITSRNPVYSALWFAMVLLSNSGLYLLQGAEFVSAATIIVYAGAIVVTFLFVIMLAQPTGAAPYDRLSREPLLSSITGLILASALVGTLHYSARQELRGATATRSVLPGAESIQNAAALPNDRQRVDSKRHVAGLGKALFLDHVVSVEVIGVLLLAAVAGAMLIAGHKVDRPHPAGSSR